MTAYQFTKCGRCGKTAWNHEVKMRRSQHGRIVEFSAWCADEAAADLPHKDLAEVMIRTGRHTPTNQKSLL